MTIRVVLTLIVIVLTSCSRQDTTAKWPEVNRETKPWTRWWWHGSAVTKEGITAELEAYSKAGLGGVEITPIYGVKGFEDKFIPYLSDEWMTMLEHTLAEAERLGMGVDMATGTGWPFGGPWVNDNDASRNIQHKVYELSAGQTLTQKITFTQQPFIRTVNPGELRVNDILQPINKNKDLQQLAIDQIRFERKLPLITLIGYSDSGESTDLTDKVESDGRLNWSPSKGKWKLYALFQGWHGKMVERAGPGGEGNVIDHFSKVALDHYLTKFDSAFRDHNTKTLRAFFNDSYEVDDARGAADWTSNILDEFQKRRGYDLKQHLPELFDSTHNDISRRILYDYRLTISELVLDNFTQPWTQWASKQGKITRNQAHGSPSNILDLYATVDIPEIEGTDPLRIRMASSAGNVSGKRLVSSESATWLDEHFESSLGDIKEAVDLFLLNGVNHIFYHGTSYSPHDEPWPGWLFYAAVHLNPRNPQWDDFDALNEYITRCQSFLQNSKADNDILLYYPVADPMSESGPEMIEHFDGIGKQFSGSDFEKIATKLMNEGYAYDFISDKQLLQVDQTTKTIIIPSCDYIPKETMHHLNKLADAGVTVVMSAKPTYYAGFTDRDKSVDVSSKIIEGFPRNVERETMTDRGLKFTRRKMNDGRLVYLVKNDSVGFDDWITLGSESFLIYDPLTGVIGKAEQQSDKIRLQLESYQTMILVKSDEAAPLFRYQKTGEPVDVKLAWTVSFDSASSLPLDALASWEKYDRANFSGTARYTTHFSLPEKDDLGWILDLGDVRESARITLNGRELGTLFSPPFRVKIEPSMAQSDNVLEVHVSNLMANRIASLDRDGIYWKKFYNINFPSRKAENRKDGLFDASKWGSRPSGLLGPVQLLPVVAQDER